MLVAVIIFASLLNIITAHHHIQSLQTLQIQILLLKPTSSKSASSQESAPTIKVFLLILQPPVFESWLCLCVYILLWVCLPCWCQGLSWRPNPQSRALWVRARQEVDGEGFNMEHNGSSVRPLFQTAGRSSIPAPGSILSTSRANSVSTASASTGEKRLEDNQLLISYESKIFLLKSG